MGKRFLAAGAALLIGLWVETRVSGKSFSLAIIGKG